MAITAGLMSSDSNEWETPQCFFDRLDAEFGFTLDAAATAENAKCVAHYTTEDDALCCVWSGVVWCNPPYGRIIGRFVQKGWEQAEEGATVVMLIPARTDTRYWHEYVMRSAEVRLVRGRLYFKRPGRERGRAPFPSAVVVFRKGQYEPKFSAMEGEAADVSRTASQIA